jgi:energy-coupling factor transporter transmembrane protein EcfT
MRPIGRPRAVLTSGFAVVTCTALLPAGLDGRQVPALSWILWTFVLLGSLMTLCAVNGSLARTIRSLAWLLPPVLLLTLPAVVFAAGGRGAGVALALVLRALSAATAGLATAAALGPPGLVQGLRALRVPPRLIAIVHAMLVSVATMVRQVSSMLRARAARRPSPAPWSVLAFEPVETFRGFGRLVGSLLLRSLERAESLERARRARGGLET